MAEIDSSVRAKRVVSPFWRHFLEMLGSMVVGMFLGTTMFVATVDVSWDGALVRYPVQALVVMAVSMTVPMVAWMLYRRHGLRRTAEMAAAMILPVVPFVCLVAFDVTEGAACGLYCLATLPAMLGVMLYRRSEYSLHV